MEQSQPIFLGADHRGFELKEAIKAWLQEREYAVSDLGNTVHDPADDFPDYALAVAQAVSQHPEARGLVFCGSGVGVSIAANKVKGIRAAAEDSTESVVEARQHNDINVLAIAADRVSPDQATELAKAFVRTPFAAEERFIRRLRKISDYEEAQG
jgi:ribose 5-phosphate isomerase B